VQIGAFGSDDFVALTTAQIKALSTSAITALGSDDLAALESDDFAALTTGQILAIASDAIAGLGTDDITQLSTADIGALSRAQLSVFGTDDFQALSTAQVKALGLTVMNSLGSDDLAALESQDFAALTSAQIRLISTAGIVGLGTEDIASLTSANVAGLTTAQIEAIGSDNIFALNSEAFGALSDAQINAILATPVVLDLNGDGVHSVNIAAGVRFDLNADGSREAVGWASGGDGFLVRDINKDGFINDGSELFGSSTVLSNGDKAKDGFAAMADLDTNQDGAINSLDSAFKDLQVWVDGNKDGVSQADELHSLDSLGIVQINLDAVRTSTNSNGNWIGLESSFETVDGTTHDLADIWLQVSNEKDRVIDLSALNPDKVEAGSLSQINLSGNGGGGDLLKLNAEDVARYGEVGVVDHVAGGGDQVHQMVIRGDQNDTVELTDHGAGLWQYEGSVSVDGVDYQVYNQGVSQLLIESHVHLIP
jgi:hypothetical protein